MDVVSGVMADINQVVAFENVESLRDDRALAPRTGGVDVDAHEVRAIPAPQRRRESRPDLLSVMKPPSALMNSAICLPMSPAIELISCRFDRRRSPAAAGALLGGDHAPEGARQVTLNQHVAHVWGFDHRAGRSRTSTASVESPRPL